MAVQARPATHSGRPAPRRDDPSSYRAGNQPGLAARRSSRPGAWPPQAEAGYGGGTYTQELAVSLVVPADSRAGTYTSSLTVTVSAGP